MNIEEENFVANPKIKIQKILVKDKNGNIVGELKNDTNQKR